MTDRVRPLKFESASTGGTQEDVNPTELNPSEDYVDAKGYAFQGDSSKRIDIDSNGELQITDSRFSSKSFSQVVRDTVLTGLAAGVDTVIAATDSFLTALQNIQAQISAHRGTGGSEHPAATQTVDGFMSAADKIKLDNLADRTTAAAVGLASSPIGTIYAVAQYAVDFLWNQAWSQKFTNGQVAYNLNAGTGGRGFQLRVVDATTGTVLAEDTVKTVSGTYYLPFTLPTSDTTLEVQIRQNTSGGQGPTLNQAQFLFDTL